MFEIDSLARLDLGRQGENLTTKIEIDMTPWHEELPDCTFVLMNVRPGETSPYAAASSTTDTLTWDVTNSDLQYEGRGVCEIRAVKGTAVKKSRIVMTVVHEGIVVSATEQPPSPMQGWADRLAIAEGNTLSAIAEALAASQRIVSMANDLITGDRLKVTEGDEGYVTLSGGLTPEPNRMMPVGSIYMTELNVDPGTLFGGEWEKVQDRVIIGSGTRSAGDTGGNPQIMLTMDQLPEEVQS